MWAYEGLQSAMGPHMYFQSAGPGIALATDIALEGLFTSMNQLVRLKVAFGDEFLAAAFKVARERSFASMYSQMSL